MSYTCPAIDPRRCTGAGIPEEVEFATKPALAGTMIDRALDAGVPARWVAADEVYGADPGCAPISKPARREMCWPLAATAACPPQPA